MKYKVFEITGEYATAANKGIKLYEKIQPELLSDQPVELDFAGVNIFATAFFNFAIGQLLSEISPEKLKRQLSISELSPNGNTLLNRVMVNAAHYYSDQQYRNAVDSVMEEYAASC